MSDDRDATGPGREYRRGARRAARGGAGPGQGRGPGEPRALDPGARGPREPQEARGPRAGRRGPLRQREPAPRSASHRRQPRAGRRRTPGRRQRRSRWSRASRWSCRAFHDVLERHGVTGWRPRGARSTPLTTRRSPTSRATEHAPNTVIEEHQRGYRLHDRLLRPALVTVGKAPGRSCRTLPRPRGGD